ncbi:protease pro-enzyme activation domain-containing protein [Granulicella sp. L60]|uniref:protease pro-enzyme activation domain-containing protein n=1 Tax=Granulicella sp. L60 TaxID=1641866 RepID=UPI0020B17373|nr:protease pro-enzyme activation domain-containing protein [Granulicella sp. L60]
MVCSKIDAVVNWRTTSREVRAIVSQWKGASNALLMVFFTVAAFGQQPASRIAEPINDASRATIANSHPSVTRQMQDVGRVSSGTQLGDVSIVLSRTAAEETDLQSLIVAQQTPSSTQYHRWLTPAQFSARFGVADADISQVKAWLAQQGFTVNGVSQSKNRISFSGTVGQVETAFGIEIHNYTTGTETHFAPSTDITVPSALASVVQTVTNLSSFRPKPRVRYARPQASSTSKFTSSQSGSYYLTPSDVVTIYDIKPAYNSGYTGEGQTIAIVGQSSIVQADITNFQNAAGLPVKDVTMVLVPNSGTSTVYSGDESESDLDVEYSGAIAKGASIYFVYVGSNQNTSVWDSIQYAVDSRIAPVISTSYGECETEMSSTDYSTYNGILAQAASQGQSVVSAAGDDGSTDCYEDTSLSATQREALAVDFPASSQYVTAMGGTEFPAADVAAGNSTYWTQASGGDVISSALSYIPEQVWNDDSSQNGLNSGGGGISTLTARPSWQTGVSGIASGSYRLIPDIALDASDENAPYLFCSSDTTSTGITGSCSNGFRDSNNEYLTAAGGTSFDAPIFAGMLAMINQKLNSTGQGVVNSTLYSLAANATTYASVFHDITSGGNECNAGTTYCESSGESQYAATTGYDLASGLGSIAFSNLLNAWPTTSSAALQATNTTVSAATTIPASGASDIVTITVAPEVTGFTTTPTGSVTLVVDGTTEGSPLNLAGGVATYTFSSTTSGNHVIQASYSGDSTYAGSQASLVVNVGGTSGSGSATFTLAATNLTVTAGSSGTSAITITPANGYTGTVQWTISTTGSALNNACYELTSATVTGTSPVTATMTIYTNASDCPTTSSVESTGKRHRLSSPIAQTVMHDPVGVPTTLVFAALIFGGFLGRRARVLRLLCAMFVVTGIGAFLSGCSNSSSASSSSSSSSVAKGTYTLTITGTDTNVSSIAATTSMVLTVD